MNEQQTRALHDMLPFGICYLKPIQSTPQAVVDYWIIDQNAKFQSLLSLHQNTAFPKRISDEWKSSIPWLYQIVMSLPFEQDQHNTISVQPNVNIEFHRSDDFLVLTVQEKAISLPQHAITDWELIFQHTHDAISVVAYDQVEFRYVRNNSIHQARSGIASIQGRTPIDLVGLETGSTLMQYYMQCLETGKSVTYEQTFAFSVGKRIWQTEVIPWHYHDGVQYLLCVSKDITELKKAQEEKELLMQKLQTMFAQHSAIMLLVDPFTKRIADANPAACAFYGYSLDEFITLKLPQIDPYIQDWNADTSYQTTVTHQLKSGMHKIVDVYASPIDHNQLLYLIIFDVTARENYRLALLHEQELLRTTLYSIDDGVVTVDHYGIITSLNRVAQKVTGWDHSAIGKPFAEVFQVADQADSMPPYLADHRSMAEQQSFCMLKNRFGQNYPITDHASLITTEDGKTLGVVIVFRDMSKERENAHQIRFLSQHDSLTNLYHRHYMEAQFPNLEKPIHLPLSIILADINGLKMTNDIFGHQAGDHVLKQVAQLLTLQCRKYDLITRWGGDEFLILLPQTNTADAEKIMERIKADSALVADSKLRLSLSLGCATKASAEKNIQDIIKEAEEMMYHQKLLDEKSYRNTMITMLLATLYEKSMETEEHSKRMERHCNWIGQSLQLSAKELDELSLLAILHDIGKVGINPAILKKPAPLTPFEWQEMRMHPEIGYRIIQTATDLKPIASYILAHHERWDGTGYPQGLAKEEIPLACRILAVTDAYDAMTNNRSYRTALSHEQALLELQRHAGTQFDPSIVQLYVALLSKQQSS